MELTDIEEIRKFLLSGKRRIVITTHRTPDGDAIGSSLAVYNFFSDRGHDVRVITPNNYPEFLHWLPGNDKVTEFKTRKKEATEYINAAELIFCLDFNSLTRLEEMGRLIGKSAAMKVLIDHHRNPEKFADHVFVDITSSSTAELVYDFLLALNDDRVLSTAISECLYAGIMTDTGSFSYNSTTARTHQAAGSLLASGIDRLKIHSLVYDSNSSDRLRLIGYALHKKMVVNPECSTAQISLTREELRGFNYRIGDTEGLVNYPLTIKGVNLSVLFVERDDVVKISFRSKGSFSVDAFARLHFEGGGHVNAAGGESKLTISDTIAQFESLVLLHKKEIGLSAGQ